MTHINFNAWIDAENSITRIVAIEHAASEESARTGDTLVTAQMMARNSSALIDALKPADAIDAVNVARRGVALSRGLLPSDYEHYSPTAAEREADARMDEWKARKREADRRILCARLADESRQRAIDCANRYAERMGSAA